MAVGGTVRFEVPVEVAFDYLVDPHRRPEWQSSLRRVEDVAGEPRVGQTWTDVTKPGLRPAMETTVLDRPRVWAETGTWRFVRADLTPALRAGRRRMRATCSFRFRIHALGPVGLGATAASTPAVRGDLKRAAAILAGR